jgi:peptidoglycan/xylan/chitin deacetylase (PgdA/CDA1 family)
MIAWPFGELPDQDLVEKAKAAGYVAAFTIVRRAASPQDSSMLLPRFLLHNTDKGKAFEAIVHPLNSSYQSRQPQVQQKTKPH